MTLVVDGEGQAFVAAPGFSRGEVANILRTTADCYSEEPTDSISHPADPTGTDPLGIYPDDATDDDIAAALRQLQRVPAAPGAYQDLEHCRRVRLLSGWLSAAVEHRCRALLDDGRPA